MSKLKPKSNSGDTVLYILKTTYCTFESKNEIWELWELWRNTFIGGHEAGEPLQIISFPTAPEVQWLPRVFLQVEGWLCVPGLRMFRPALAQLFYRCEINEPKPKNLQCVFSKSSNPQRPGQGARAAVPVLNMYHEGVGSGNWCPAISAMKWRNRKKLLCRLEE